MNSHSWLEITHMLRWPLAALAVHLLQLHDLQPPREIGRAHGLHAVGGAGGQAGAVAPLCSSVS
eukprot:COSAG01_NODE_4634_length_4859_cov_62.188866_4_plen_64_part_00